VRGFASRASAGERVPFGDGQIRVAALDAEALRGVDIVFLAAGDAVSRAHAHALASAGATVLDLSGCFLSDSSVPLVVAEVNIGVVFEAATSHLLTVGTGAMAAVAAALAPLARLAAPRLVGVTTFEPVSGAGQLGISTLGRETMRLLSGQSVELSDAEDDEADAPPAGAEAFSRQIAFNCIPVIGGVGEAGATVVEEAFAIGLRRVLEAPGLCAVATAVRVPTFYGLGVAVTVESERAIAPGEAMATWREAPGLMVADAGEFVTPIEAVSTDAVYVSRVRVAAERPTVLSFWLALDNVRKGAALNAVAVAEALLRRAA
jgi:aspartate-semialdehyde dehydrogenase